MLLRISTIRSKAECVGIFGITSRCNVLKNIIVYSDERQRRSKLQKTVQKLVLRWRSCRLCRPAETILQVYLQTARFPAIPFGITMQNDPGWGGGSVGGLVGMTNMDITNCSAVTDIIINIGYNGGYQNLRVGGIAGVSRGTVNYCYAGGSMSSISSMWVQKLWNAGANIWMGGLSRRYRFAQQRRS